MSDPRFLALSAWIARTLGDEADIALICGDASFRRYFRIHFAGETYIAMDSPPNLVPVEPFIALSKEYLARQIKAPQVLNADPEQGFLLLSDLGDCQLLSVLTPDNVAHYYGQALSLLDSQVSITHADEKPLTDYDAAFVLTELNIFVEWLLKRHLKLVIDDATVQMILRSFQCLVDNAMAQPKVGMHRDFHSRNLMLSDGELAVIDFQDAVIGPVTYDAVSLLRDCYVRWPDELVNALMLSHYRQMLALGVLSDDVDESLYQRWFDLMGIQRHIKAAGIFCRLNYRDNKPGYMKDIPLTLKYISDIGKQYDELQPLVAWLDSQVIPKMESSQ